METVTHKSGRTLTRDVTVYADADQATPYDLTDAVVSFTLQDRPGGNLVETGASAVTDADAGEIIAVLPAEATVGWEERVLYAQVVVDELGGKSTVVDEFKLHVEPSSITIPEEPEPEPEPPSGRGAAVFTGEGPPPEDIPGSQPGDVYLDVTTGSNRIYVLGEPS